MQTLYTQLKINNEIELCELSDLEIKQKIERVLLQNRISYYIKWVKPKLFSRNKSLCIICVNDNHKDDAEIAIKSLGREVDGKVKFVIRKSANDFF